MDLKKTCDFMGITKTMWADKHITGPGPPVDDIAIINEIEEDAKKLVDNIRKTVRRIGTKDSTRRQRC